MAHGDAAPPQQPHPKRRKTDVNEDDDTDEESKNDRVLIWQMEADFEDEDELNLLLDTTIPEETAPPNIVPHLTGDLE